MQKYDILFDKKFQSVNYVRIGAYFVNKHFF